MRSSFLLLTLAGGSLGLHLYKNNDNLIILRTFSFLLYCIYQSGEVKSMSTNDSTQNEKARSVLKDILKDTDVVMLTTISEDGNIVSRPMQTQEIEFDEDLWFITRKDTTKYKEISANPNVNVTVVGDSYASISGKAVFVDDVERKKEFWNKIYEKMFDVSYDDPMLILIKVEADKAEYWETGNTTKSVANFFKKVVGNKDSVKPGENSNETVDL